MKKLVLFALALLYVGMASAKINTVVVNTSGDVTLRQGDAFSCSGGPFTKTDSVIYLKGSDNYQLTVEELNYLTILSSGDVITENALHGDNLSITFNSSGDSKLDVNYDNIYVMMTGSGDLVLRGQCDVFDFDHDGSGDLNTKELVCGVREEKADVVRVVPSLAGLSELLAELGVNLERLTDSVDWKSFESDMERWAEGMEEWGRHMEEWGEKMERQMDGKAPRDNHYRGPQPKREPKPKEEPKPKSLIFDPYWGGIDAGLNLLMGPGRAANFDGPYAFLETKPLKSWVFNFNIADVGIAFSRSHVAGLYTGIGLGWNNYSFNNPVRLIKGENALEAEWIDENVEGRVKKSKLGVLYVHAPLMLEVRPSRSFFIAAGVTGGVRVDTWTKIKFENRSKEKIHSDYYVYPFKLDATLRAGGKDMGFFASFNLLPLFDARPETHTFNVGFSMIF